MAFKKITLEEWKAMGLPLEINNFYIDNTKLFKKIKKHNKKTKEKINQR